MKKITAYFFTLIVLLLSGCDEKEKVANADRTESVYTSAEITSAVAYSSNNNTISKSETKLLCVPNLNQNPTLPTGCEATSATMVLRYYKEDITATDFAEYCLPKSEDFYIEKGVLYGPNPNECFVGNPFSKSGYGCFSPVIVEAVNSNSRLCRAKRVYGNLEELCRDYIDKDKPLLIWATMNMKSLRDGDSWRLQNGEVLNWPAGEHCLVLVGYDRFNYYFNDPLKGNTVGYEKKTAEACFTVLGSQAVLIEAYN